MNILITLDCNRSCPYCFLQLDTATMTLTDAQAIVDLDGFSDLPNVRILGGEPTLHPQFVDVVRLFRRHNKNLLTVFTNGLFSPDILPELRVHDLLFVINVNSPGLYNIDDWGVIEDNIAQLKHHGFSRILSKTIDSPDFDYAYLVRLCEEHDVDAVRWSLAMPGFRRGNSSLSLEDIVDMKERILQFLSDMLANGVFAFNDCPLPECVFSKGEVEAVCRAFALPKGLSPLKVGQCDPPFDVFPDLSVRGCVGIGDRIHFDLRTVGSIHDLRRQYQSLLGSLSRPERTKCSTCRRCEGGCWGYSPAEHAQ